MKVFISTDIEGVSGVVGREETNAQGGQYYEMAKRRLTLDVNAAIEGALEAGAEEFLVADFHALRMNIIYEELHPAADLIRGTPDAHRPLLLMEGIDESFNVVLLVGYHARAGDWNGILSHTYSSRIISSLRFNDIEVSEARMGAAIAGSFGVPVGMVSGDDRTCAEVADWLPGVETAVVKVAIDRYAARCISHKKALERIRDSARRAVQRAGEFAPFTFEDPVRFEMVLFDPSLAHRMTTIPGLTRVASDTVAFEGKDFSEAHAAFWAALYVAFR